MSSSRPDQLLIVLSILEGRRFPKRLRHQLVVEARFDGESLFTDPVEHSEQPEFATELAWELDRKSLHQHRLQRTPIKLQCFAVDSPSAKEPVGYVVLDLRSVQEKPTPPKWYPLLSSKYAKTRPELRIGVLLENDSKAQPDAFRARDAPPRDALKSPLSITKLMLLSARIPNAKALTAVLDEEEGFYWIGPSRQATDIYVVSVTIAFAAHLEQLVPSSMRLPEGKPEFYFYYTLLGNSVANDPFTDLLNPNFSPERASLKIRSTVDVLQRYFSLQPPIQIHLCCGEQSLGSTEVSLEGLARREVDMRPVTVEGVFALVPPNKTKQKMPPLASDEAPSVGVSVTLRREGAPSREASPDNATSKKRLPSKEPTKPASHLEVSKQASIGVPPSPPTKQSASSQPKAHGSSPPPSSFNSPECSGHGGQASRPQQPRSDHATNGKPSGQPSQASGPPVGPAGLADSRGNSTGNEGESLEDDGKGRGRTSGAGSKEAAPVSSAATGSESGLTSGSRVAIPATAHHMCFSLDLRSIRDLALDSAISCLLRYSYPFFGSAAPIMTNPPVEVRKHMEVFLPQSYCMFEFATLPQQLEDTFYRVPLVVELWHRDRLAKDSLLGVARLPLSHVLTTERARFLAPDGGQCWRQAYGDRAPVLATHGSSEKIAELNYTMTLEDRGTVKTQQVLISEHSQEERIPLREAPRTRPEPTPAVAVVKEPRQSQEYQAALELEMWKEMQEDLFENQLKQKELVHMQALAEEWKRRDKEREALVKKKVSEYSILEEKLRTTLCDLERREKELVAGEHELRQLQRELEGERQRAQLEAADRVRRANEDCSHQLELERLKLAQMEEARGHSLTQLREAEQRHKALEREFQQYHEQQNVKPEVRLQSEINLLNLEKVELERKLDSALKSKLHYKQQWGRALKELARIKQREQENALARLHKQQTELEHMRLRYLAAEEKEVVRADRQELEGIKNDLNRLKLQEQQKEPGPKPAQLPLETAAAGAAPRAAPGHGGGAGAAEESHDAHLTRLIEERDTLLRTGVYTHDDRIVVELDRQIRDAISRHDGSVGHAGPTDHIGHT
ncbi:centrosomal protein of 120 kDa isoform X1 [Petromyzon marinus]|uniref:centrosomal protein of 120 kDa isoform X1 n=2 Tax=Petromyzon marinus TaxID=7757 RepID=UPI003F731241